MNLFDVTGRLALVTGSSRGLGLALASGLAEAGARVVLHGRGGPALAEAQQTVAALSDEPVPVVEFDVTDAEAVRDGVVDLIAVPAAGNAAIGTLKRRGILAQVGMLPAGGVPVEMATVVSRELQLRGCFRFADEIDAAIAMLAANPSIEQVITHEVDLADSLTGFGTAKDSEVSGKVLVRLDEGAAQ